MYRAQDREEVDDVSESMITTTAWYSWPDLEPALLSAIAKRLKKQDQGSMRLVCRAWCTAVSDGIHDLAVSCKIVEDQLRNLPRIFPQLRKLDLSGYAWLTDSEFAGFKDLTKLRDFTLVFGHELSDSGVQCFRHLTRLDSLSLTNFMRLDDHSIQSIACLTQLTRLKIQGSPRITDAGVQCLQEMQCLEILTMSHLDQLSDGSMIHFARLRQLQSLTLSGNRNLLGSKLSQLKVLGKLSRLDLARTRFIDQSAGQLKQLTQLRHLSLAYCQITDRSLLELRDLHLESLDLTKCRGITEKGINCLTAAERLVPSAGTHHGKQLVPDQLIQCVLIAEDDVVRQSQGTSLNEQPGVVPTLSI